jgi:hypothetical protein
MGNWKINYFNHVLICPSKIESNCIAISHAKPERARDQHVHYLTISPVILTKGPNVGRNWENR